MLIKYVLKRIFSIIFIILITNRRNVNNILRYFKVIVNVNKIFLNFIFLLRLIIIIIFIYKVIIKIRIRSLDIVLILKIIIILKE